MAVTGTKMRRQAALSYTVAPALVSAAANHTLQDCQGRELWFWEYGDGRQCDPHCAYCGYGDCCCYWINS